MPKWLQGMVGPTLMLWLCAVAFGIVHGLVPTGTPFPARADFVSRLAFPLVVASWILADARKRGRGLWYDYDSFVFFYAPVFAPIYLFQTRGLRAFLTLLSFAGICLVAGVARLVVYLTKGFESL